MLQSMMFVSLLWHRSCITFKKRHGVTSPILSMHLVVFLGCGSQHSTFERARTSCAGVRKESSRLHPGKHQVCVLHPCLLVYSDNVTLFVSVLCFQIELFIYSHPFCRYTVISGTPEKILEHFLETMRMDIHPSEPGSRLEKNINNAKNFFA